jgi:hypothetical protein
MKAFVRIPDKALFRNWACYSLCVHMTGANKPARILSKD